MLAPSTASNMKGGAMRSQIAMGQELDAQPMGEDDEQIDGEGPDALAVIAALGAALVKHRDAAKEHRQQLGIEHDWQEDEEFYQSVDVANPEGDSHVSVQKPVSPDGGASGVRPKESRSSVFIPITRAYVDAAAARVSDMLLPTDDKPWALKPTPVADGGPPMAQTPVAQVTSAVAAGVPTQTMPGMAPGFAPPEAPADGSTPAYVPGGTPSLPAGVASSAISDDEKRADLAEQRLEDWMVECQWSDEVRKVIEDAAKVGTGVLKGPFPVQKTVQKMVRSPDGTNMLVQETMVVPVSRRVPYRNLFPAPDAGDDIQNGSFVFEYDSIGMRALRKLAKDPTYIHENIVKVLKEGPNFAWAQDTPSNEDTEKNRIGGTFPLWYFYGDLDKETLLAAGLTEQELADNDDELALAAIPALVIMVNDTVIKASLNPMESGGFPYDVFPWQRRDGMVWGKGISRQMRTPQRMLNSAVRAMMDNGGLTSGPMWCIREDWVVPMDGRNELGPRKGFRMTSDAPPNAKMEDAISFTNIESNINELKLVVDMANKFAEDATGLPMLMQGQQGEATDTAAGMTILNNNGGTVLRRIARTFDGCITERHVRRYYAWLMENPGNDNCKGDFQIDARGSNYLVERDLQNKLLNQLVPYFAQHPDVHPGRFAEEVARANRLNYQRFMLTDAEKAAKAKQPPPVPYQVQVAQIRDAGDTKRMQMKLQADVQLAAQQNKLDEGKLQSAWELGLAKLEQEGNLSTNNAKAMLAATVMRLKADLHMHHMDKTTDVTNNALTASVEQPGRAAANQGAIA